MATETELGRAFTKECRRGHDVLNGKQVDTIDMHPGERMMLLVDLAGAISGEVSDGATSHNLTYEMSTNLFRFLNTQISWQEILAFVCIISRQMDISFTLLGQKTPEGVEFARRMREYLRGTI